jgi:uncharacterized protein (TIGR00369 family)
MVDSPPERVRTVRWHDPSQFGPAAQRLTGMEMLSAIIEGRLDPPPVADLLGMRLVHVEPSRATFEFDPGEYMYNPLGMVHGGILTVLLDSAMGCAFHTGLPAGVSYTTLELKVNFVRPVTLASGPMRAEGWVLHAGSRVATTESRLVDRDDKLYAHASSTLLVLRPDSK